MSTECLGAIFAVFDPGGPFFLEKLYIYAKYSGPITEL